jgi:hypothetical protein
MRLCPVMKNTRGRALFRALQKVNTALRELARGLGRGCHNCDRPHGCLSRICTANALLLSDIANGILAKEMISQIDCLPIWYSPTEAAVFQTAAEPNASGSYGAGDGNRTHLRSLGGSQSKKDSSDSASTVAGVCARINLA